jgi:hypothetical protein
MRELARPFLYVWDWCGQVGGFAGQVFAITAFVMVIIGILTWLGNKK